MNRDPIDEKAFRNMAFRAIQKLGVMPTIERSGRYRFVMNGPVSRHDVLGLFNYCKCLRVRTKAVAYRNYFRGLRGSMTEEKILPPDTKPYRKYKSLGMLGKIECAKAIHLVFDIRPYGGRDSLWNEPGELIDDPEAPRECRRLVSRRIATHLGQWRNEYEYQPVMYIDGMPGGTQTFWFWEGQTGGQTGGSWTINTKILVNTSTWAPGTITIRLKCTRPDGGEQDRCSFKGNDHRATFTLE
ncbi:MAG: hypothetical protein HQ559_02415 [Lentisphaerae bacterium]|nr:hypothetical protein [Lentisphaerota bacterium]